jgi:hypothetical protein
VVLLSTGGGEQAIYNKERILSKYDRKFKINREDNWSSTEDNSPFPRYPSA